MDSQIKFKRIACRASKKKAKSSSVKKTKKTRSVKEKIKTEWDPKEPWDTSMLIPVTVSRMRREASEAELGRIKVEKELAKLISAKEAEDSWVKIGTITRTKVLGIPSKARQRMPDLTDSQYKILEMIVREALEEIRNENVTADKDNE